MMQLRSYIACTKANQGHRRSASAGGRTSNHEDDLDGRDEQLGCDFLEDVPRDAGAHRVGQRCGDLRAHK